ncbi:MAG: polysaccharide export protein [candidate division KSB1 bacterium]|nr:polysaccharide export protein [candidate division KSB1 bacterium]MDZ7364289.1 polysaccharide export protein [candidate division KSB1 bacterium]MDZ7405012.1 polysaccharide export protein [candidate division KSB1 bacterium]
MVDTRRTSLAVGIFLVLGMMSFGCVGTHSSRSEFENVPVAAVAKTDTVIIAPAIAPKVAAPPEYRIGTLDELEIRVRYHERLNVIVKVRPDGRITLEDLGDFFVLGMTPAELDNAITAAYAGIIHEPEVTVFVRSFAGLSAYVLGEVRNPGIVELRPKMTVLQALAAANGPIRGAKMSSVMMLRRDAAGQLKAMRLDLNSAAVKNAAHEDVYIQPEDIIFVPKTFFASANHFLTQVYDGLLPPLDVYLRALRIQVRTN